MPLLLRSLIALSAVMALAIHCAPSNADELSLGLWTKHYDREVKPYECGNEKHNLVAYTHSTGFMAGMYDNSHCLKSYFVGYQKSLYRYKGVSAGVAAQVVTGYPKSMHWLGNAIVIPMFSASYKYDGFGVRFISVPTLLNGVGFVYEF